MSTKISKEQQHQFDLCHAYGHAMFEIDVNVKSEIGYPTGLKCERCDTLRVIILSIHGEMTQTWYEHTDSYSKSLERRLTRAQARAEIIKYKRAQHRVLRAV